MMRANDAGTSQALSASINRISREVPLTALSSAFDPITAPLTLPL